MPKKFNAKEIVISANGAQATEYPHTKKLIWDPNSPHTQKSTQNRSLT